MTKILFALLFACSATFAQVQSSRTANYVCSSPKNAAQMYYLIFVTDLYWQKVTQIDIAYASNYGTEAVTRFTAQRVLNNTRQLVYVTESVDGKNADLQLRMQKKQGAWTGDIQFKVAKRDGSGTRKVELGLQCFKNGSSFPPFPPNAAQ